MSSKRALATAAARRHGLYQRDGGTVERNGLGIEFVVI